MNAVATIEQMPAPRESAIDKIIGAALSADEVDIDRMVQLYDLKTRYEADEARKLYVAAMAAFKAEKLQIVKDKTVAYTGTRYTHATLGNVVAVIAEALGRHGFSHRWDTQQNGGEITVTCIITHAAGHSESTVLIGKPDDSGKKNAIQQVASTVTYLQRYTLLAATGLATRDQEDTDGRDDDEPEAPDRNIINQWIGVLDAAPTAEALSDVRSKIIDDYRGVSNVPEALQQALKRRKQELAGTGGKA